MRVDILVLVPLDARVRVHTSLKLAVAGIAQAGEDVAILVKEM